MWAGGQRVGCLEVVVLVVNPVVAVTGNPVVEVERPAAEAAALGHDRPVGGGIWARWPKAWPVQLRLRNVNEAGVEAAMLGLCDLSKEPT